MPAHIYLVHSPHCSLLLALLVVLSANSISTLETRCISQCVATISESGYLSALILVILALKIVTFAVVSLVLAVQQSLQQEDIKTPDPVRLSMGQRQDPPKNV